MGESCFVLREVLRSRAQSPKSKVQSRLDEKRRVEPSAGQTLLRLIGCLRTANPTQPRSPIFRTIGINSRRQRGFGDASS